MPEEKNDNTQSELSAKANQLISRLERQLNEIEYNEIISGRTADNLKDSNLVGSKPICVQRSEYNDSSRAALHPYHFQGDYDIVDNKLSFKQLDISAYLHLTVFQQGSVVAIRDIESSLTPSIGENIRCEKKDDKEYYCAETNGRVLLHNGKLVLLPSDRDAVVEVAITNDRMEANITCEPAYGNGKHLSSAIIYQALKERGVCFGILDSAVLKAVEHPKQTTMKVNAFPVAFGKPAIPGREGQIIFKFNTETPPQDFKLLSDGRIDYRNSLNLLMAKKGDLLAVVREPVEGTPGINVLGEPISAPKGDEAILVNGRGVIISENGKEFYANTNGHIVLNGCLLEIQDLYVVNGDVDYASGNIAFDGTVIIKGDIKDGFEVKATGDITVFKNVEAAKVYAGRDIVIKGGVVSKNRGIVSAGRDISVEYVQNGRLEAQGNIEVRNFSVNGYLCSSKWILLKQKKGAIIGGEAYAQKGIDVRQIGSVNSRSTIVESGTDFLVRKKIVEVEDALKFVEENIVKIETVLQPVIDTFKMEPELLGHKQDIIIKTIQKQTELKTNRKVMERKQKELYAQLNEQGECPIKVSGECYPDAVIKIRNLTLRLPSITMHKQFYDDRKTGEIKIMPYV